jgi:peptidylprolyl isomerase
VVKTKLNVSVTGKFGQKPALTVPTSAAPTTSSLQILSPGTGPTVVATNTLVADYLGQTWVPKDGKPDIFDNSYDRGSPAGFGIGVPGVIDGWNKLLVGQKVGSRVLLFVAPADAYPKASNPDSELADKALLFVVDIRGAYDRNATASGTVRKVTQAGFPQVQSVSGRKPVISSVTGAVVGTTPKSALLLAGTGAAIDPTKTMVVQVVQADTATGKQKTESFGDRMLTISGEQLLATASVLKGQKVGSRALIVTPKSSAEPSYVVIVDVIAQL